MKKASKKTMNNCVINMTPPETIKRKTFSIFTVHGENSLDCFRDDVSRKRRRGAIKERLSRTFGWYSSFKRADKAVKENNGDLWEYAYHYIVIEEFPEGVWALRKKEWWYKWNGKRFYSIKKPDFISNTVNWGMG